MKLRPEQLEAHLQGGLQPIYLLSGDEPLQLGEAGDLIRHRARELGHSDREVMDVEGNFDWNSLGAASDTLSLFAEQRLLELRLKDNKFGRDGGAALADYAANPPADTVLLISCGKLDKKQQAAKWFKAVEQVGVVIQIWPVEAAQMPRWVQQRMASRGLQATPEAVQLLADRVEGNLLAAAQEVEKLVLLHGAGAQLDAETVEQGVGDSARFDIFALADSALAGDARRVSRMVEGLRAEGVEPILLLWVLAREIRALNLMAADLADGMAIPQVMRNHRVWQKRTGPVGAALGRLRPKQWGQLLRRCARIDRIVKGAESGNPWDELLQLALLVAGKRIL